MKMKKLLISFLLLLACVPYVGAQEGGKLLSMEEAVLGYGLYVQNRRCVWTEDSSAYTYVDNNAIVAVDVRTGKSRNVITLDEVKAATGAELRSLTSYAFADGALLITAAGHDYAIGLDSKELIYDYVQPEGANVTSLGGGRYVFTRENNLYYADQTEERAITSYVNKNMVCGQSVSRNEFGISGGIFPSPDGSKVAFYRKDESRVTSFPLLDVTTRTGSLMEIKYPMNGMASEFVAVGVYDVNTKKTVWLDVDDFDAERYLTNVTWDLAGEKLYVQVLDRAQKHMNLNSYDAATGEFVKKILSEENEKFVEPQNPLYFVEGDADKFIYTTDNRDGFYNLYLCSVSEGTVERLTKTDADVAYLAQRGGRYVYYTSAEVSPVDNHLFRVDMKNGKVLRLTSEAGWHTCAVSPDGKYFIDSYSSLDVPRVVKLADTEGKKSSEIYRAENPSAAFNYGEITMGTIKSADGRFDNHYRLIKPINFDPSKKYPVIVYVYGGPHSQMVQNTFQASMGRWEMYMAQRGYVVFVMDNRGTDNQGAEFAKATHKYLGQCEMEDQVKGVEWLKSHPWVDGERIGVHGWSYGGFMTISLMTNYPDLFKVGVAGGPVIDWKWYEVMYGERYMETAVTNPDGFEKTSLIPMASKLEGKLLICQGAIDNTVVWQHCLNFVEACIKSGVQLDFFPYPTHEHNVYGVDRVHLMQKVTDYFEDNL